MRKDKQGSYRQGQVKFKDFSRTFQGLFKDKSYHFQGLGVDAVVGGSVLTLVSFLIKKFVKVPDKDCS